MRAIDIWQVGLVASVLLTVVLASQFADIASRDGRPVLTTRQRLKVASMPLAAAIRTTGNDNLALLVELFRPQHSRTAELWRISTIGGVALVAGFGVAGPPPTAGPNSVDGYFLIVAGAIVSAAAFWGWQAVLAKLGVGAMWWRIGTAIGLVAAIVVISTSASVH